MTRGHFLLIYNPKAGKGQVNRSLEYIRRFYQEKNISLTETTTPYDSSVPAPDWSRFEVAVVCGGDGTLHRLVNCWGIPPLPVALVQLGSGNDFARETGGKVGLEKQLLASLGKNTIKADAGICNGKIFFTGVGIGFDGLIAHKIAGQRLLRGHAAYYYTVLKYLFFYREQPLEIFTDKGHWKEKSFMLTIGNTPAFGGGFRITPEARATDGVFDLCLVKKVNFLERIIHLGKVQRGTHLHLSCVSYLKTKTARINAEKELPCHMDGEQYSWKEFEISLLPAAIELKVASV